MSSLVAARFEEEDKKLLVKVCRDRGEDISDFVRRAVMAELARMSLLSQSRSKSLGVSK